MGGTSVGSGADLSGSTGMSAMGQNQTSASLVATLALHEVNAHYVIPGQGQISMTCVDTALPQQSQHYARPGRLRISFTTSTIATFAPYPSAGR